VSPSVESVVVGLGTGIVVLAISLLLKRIPRPVAVLMAIGISLIAIVVWPRAFLVSVPDLSGLSRDDAVLRLSGLKLGAAPEPQLSSSTPVEHVVASSQDLPPGTRVKPGTVVHFSISTQPPGTIRTDSSSAPSYGTASIFSPTSGGEVALSRGADNVYRFEVQGAIDGVDLSKSTLLLWVQPIDPPSDQPGWYLQRLPANGIRSVSGDRWRGVCQVGNQNYPPHDGDVVEVATTILASDEAQQFLARQGPITIVTLPGAVSKIVRVKLRAH
jgi:hypothetical protein